jgi:hypothetical protein
VTPVTQHGDGHHKSSGAQAKKRSQFGDPTQLEKNERPQNGAETWEWDVFENRLESVRDFKFCYECFGSVGEKGPVIFPVFTAGTTVSRHAARRCGELLSR